VILNNEELKQLEEEININEKFIQEIALAILEYCKNNDFDLCETI
jgi:hypothetical protein